MISNLRNQISQKEEKKNREKKIKCKGLQMDLFIDESPWTKATKLFANTESTF